MSTATAGPAGSSRGGTGKGDVFPSRIDAWLVVVAGSAVGLCLFQAWSQRSLPALAIGALSAVIILLFTVPCRYTLEADHLSIRCGIVHKRIPYAEIKRIELSSSPLSAPALSLRRVKIFHGRSSQLVSPRERLRFITEISKRAGLDSPLTSDE